MMPQDTIASDTPHQLVLVTGPSGAGRSTAINALEDLGFEVIDNLPLSLLPRLLEGDPLERPLALGVDVRNRDFSAGALIEVIDEMADSAGVNEEVLYLDCRTDVLIRRYSETRRIHPLANGSAPADGIAIEVDLLAPIRARANRLIDTSEMSPNDLRSQVARTYSLSNDAALGITIESFSYKRGVPRGADFVFDCRFLRNPHWDEALRAMNGRDRPVQSFVADDPRYDPFFNQTSCMIADLLPAFSEAGKSHLTISFGCTGGQHRSVAVAEALSKILAEAGWQVSIRHRELERRSALERGQIQGDHS